MVRSIREAGSDHSSPPERLADRGYWLRARLGGGRLGAIYQAQDDLSRSAANGQFVAIQLIDAKIASRPGFAAAFDRGAMELQALSHPNIVKLLDHGHDRDRYYLVSEYLEGASLRFVLGDVDRLSLDETAAIIRALGDALQYLHAKSIAHGNLRPENVVLTFDYEVKLLDVVAPRWLACLDDGRGVSPPTAEVRDDVFGLGCLAYEMLAGRHPFNGNTAEEAHRAGSVAVPIEDVPEREWRALAGAMTLRRADRTENVAQFLDGFGVDRVGKLRTVVSAAAPARPTSDAVMRAPARNARAGRVRSARRKRSRIAGMALLAMASIGLGTAVWFNADRLRQHALDLVTLIHASMGRVLESTSGGSAAQSRAGATDAATEPLQARPADAPPRPPAMPRESGADASAMPKAAVQDPPVAPGPAEPAATTVSAAALRSTDRAVARMTGGNPAPASGSARFSFSQRTITVRESEGAARIVIHRSGDLSLAASVAWWPSEGTATSPEDYADIGARIEHFRPGESRRTVYVPLTSDSVAEGTKSLNVHLQERRGAPVTSLRIDIVDDD